MSERRRSSRRTTLAILVLLLAFGALVACDGSDKVKLYVFPDWVKLEEQLTKSEIEAFRAEGKALLINGKDIVFAERALLSKTDYEDFHEVKSSDHRFHLAITAQGKTIYEKDLEAGAYLVNLSDQFDVWFAQLSYGGAFAGTPQFLERGPVGAYRLGARRQPAVFKFDREPPKSVRRSRTSTASDEYFVIGSYTERGLAMRKKVLAEGQEQEPERPRKRS